MLYTAQVDEAGTACIDNVIANNDDAEFEELLSDDAEKDLITTSIIENVDTTNAGVSCISWETTQFKVGDFV